jgi:hypothetical protein
MMLPPQCFTIGMVLGFPPDATLVIRAKVFNLGFIRPENLPSLAQAIQVMKVQIYKAPVQQSSIPLQVTGSTGHLDRDIRQGEEASIRPERCPAIGEFYLEICTELRFACEA